MTFTERYLTEAKELDKAKLAKYMLPQLGIGALAGAGGAWALEGDGPEPINTPESIELLRTYHDNLINRRLTGAAMGAGAGGTLAGIGAWLDRKHLQKDKK